ncbi:MAG: hypothetical protein AVDCRST_MAG41-1749, partial [uncultured Corynebacteriales bacterium]
CTSPTTPSRRPAGRCGTSGPGCWRRRPRCGPTWPGSPPRPPAPTATTSTTRRAPPSPSSGPRPRPCWSGPRPGWPPWTGRWPGWPPAATATAPGAGGPSAPSAWPPARTPPPASAAPA